MHEMSVAQNILGIVREHIVPQDGKKVRTIRLKIGELAGVVPDSLLFCFDTLKNDSFLSNASLEIEYISITAQCKHCGKTSPLDYGVFFCPVCSSPDIVLLTGNELNIVEIELDD
jgi:hydrogenase nickel incorporation protein HypA/HybF